MNMGIEQFVYEQLNYPKLITVGETASVVEKRERKIDYIEIIDERFKRYTDESIEHVLTEDTRINIFAQSACDLYHVMGYFSMPNQKLHYECNVFLGDRQGVNTGTEYIRSQLEMNAIEKAFCRAHFYNYTRYNAFDSKIFDPQWDYIILSFLAEMRNRIYEFKCNKNLRAVIPWNRLKNNTLDYVINIDGVTKPSTEQEIEWIERNFNVRFISQQRFADNLSLIANRVPPQTKLILVTAPDIGNQFGNYPAEVLEQIQKINAVVRAFGQQFPDKFAVVEINQAVNTRDDVTDDPFHLKALTAYNLFLKIIDTIVRQFPNRKLPMLHQVLNGRKVCLVGKGDLEMLNAFYNLSFGNCRPHEFAYPVAVNRSIFPISDWNKYRARSDEYFVVVADNFNYPSLRQMLIDSKYKPLRDFVQLKPLPYNFER